jgi:hypothetical protein
MTDNANLPPNAAPRHTPSLGFPLILIVIGGLFLYANWKPDIDPWHVLGTYWPLILIFLGLGKIWSNTRQGGVPQRYSSGVSLAVLLFVVVMIFLVWHNKSFSKERGDRAYSSAMRHVSRTVDLAGAKSVNANIDFPTGELIISGGAANLLEGEFDQGENVGGPKIVYEHSGDEGTLAISRDQSHDHLSFPGHSDSHWNLRFGGGVPLDLKIDMGAGRGDLHLRDLPVTKLLLNIGAGQVNADLTGDRKQDLSADIEGGVGQAQIRLPKNVGVIVEASGGIGSVDTHGLKKEGGRYVNDAYGKSPATIHLKVQGGIGNITLTEEP